MPVFSFRAQIMLCMLCTTVIAFCAPVYYARVVLHKAVLQETQNDILRKAEGFAQMLEGKDMDVLRPYALSAAAMGMRLSVIDAQGTVLLDTQQNDEKTKPDNHSDRPEVREALQAGQGTSLRYSLTLRDELVYAAVRCADGRVLRLAMPYVGVQEVLDKQVRSISLAACAALVVALLLALLLSAGIRRQLAHMVRVVENISLGNYDCRLRRVPGKEFMPLADAVNRMAQNINDQIKTMQDQAGQLASVLDTMDDGVLVLDGRGRVRRYNRAFMQLFPAARESQDAPVLAVVPDPHVQEAVEALLHSANESEQVREQHVQMEGVARSLNVHISAPAQPSAALGAVAVFRDVSALLRLERVRQDFVANASHELRTPLTAIQSYAETLAAMGGTAEQQQFCAVILKNSTYLRRLIDALLQLTRLEQAGTATMPMQPVDPRACLDDALAFCSAAIQARHLQVAEDIAPDLRVLGSEQHITQVFCNLLSNACRYAPEGSTLLARAQLHKDGMVALCIGDQGKGIPQAEQERVFERFYRVEKHRGQGNTGLGLAICKHIVEAHGGHIWVQSPAEGYSTLFSFTLPQAAAAKEC
jgi:two-component system, OmpR family, phosphate regulon sensor histidine kinase PhoR